MPITTTQMTIANRALQIVGYKAIGSIQDNDRGARAINRAYQPVLLSMLRDNYWGFAIKRAVLPASATPPAFGPANYFPLPNDFLDLAPPDQSFSPWSNGGPVTGPPSVNDWVIENGQIASDQPSPLQIRYVSSAITESSFDASFAEAFAALLAGEVCEELTQSNTKLAACAKIYDDAMETAKQRNAFEGRPVQPPLDTYIQCRF